MQHSSHLMQKTKVNQCSVPGIQGIQEIQVVPGFRETEMKLILSVIKLLSLKRLSKAVDMILKLLLFSHYVCFWSKG